MTTFTLAQQKALDVLRPNLGEERIAPRQQNKCAVSRSLFAILAVTLACSVGASAQVASLTMTSDAGDYIGGGQFYFYTPADGIFSAGCQAAKVDAAVERFLAK
jgi:hypothetical protein